MWNLAAHATNVEATTSAATTNRGATFADPKAGPVIKSESARLHESLGTCRVDEIVHEAQGWGIEAACSHATAHFYVEEKKSKLTQILVTRTDVASPCAAAQ